MAQKAKADAEFQALLAEVRKREAEKKERVEEKWKAEEAVEEKHKVEEAAEERQKAHEVEEAWRTEVVEVKRKKAEKVKAIANQVVENHWTSEEVWKPSSLKAVVP